MTLLTNEGATRTAVLSALETLAAKLDADSTLCLFFVGHGMYGTEGNYYLTTHDSQLDGQRVKAGTSVSELELIDKLREIKAKRMLLLINACHSGKLSPSFDVSAALSSEPPPQKLTEALLSTGEGRITITACRPEQKSWIGTGKLSVFTDAVVSGLKGEAPNSHGHISAYGLYEHIYFSAREAAGVLVETDSDDVQREMIQVAIEGRAFRLAGDLAQSLFSDGTEKKVLISTESVGSLIAASLPMDVLQQERTSETMQMTLFGETAPVS